LPPLNSSVPPPYRVFFYIHGGALHLGHRGNARQICTEMAMRGFMSVAPSYSLSSLSNDQIQSMAIVSLVGIIMVAPAVTSGTTVQLLFMLVLTAIILLTLVTVRVDVCAARTAVSSGSHQRCGLGLSVDL